MSNFIIVLMWTIREWYLATLKEWIHTWAEEKGFEVFDKIEPAAAKRFKGISIYNESITRSLFCYKFEEKGKSYTALLSWNNSHAAFPEYYIILFDHPISKGTLVARRETMSDKAEAAMGHNDLDFEHKEFSDRFYVEAKPEKFAYRFFHPRMMELFLEETDKKFELYIHDGTFFFIKKLEVAPLPCLFRLITRRKIIPDWHDEGVDLIGKTIKLLPGYMKDGGSAGDQDKKDGMLKLECPKCSCDFKIGKDQKNIKCPHCGVEGRI